MKKYNNLDFIKKAKDVHKDKYDYSKVVYINCDTKVCIVCPEHGEFWQAPKAHLHGQGCPKCAIISTHEKQKNNKENFIEASKIIHGNKYDYSKVQYENNKKKVCIICHEKDEEGNEHGEFWQKPNSHLYGRGCPYCGKTKKLTLSEFVKRAEKIHQKEYDYSKVDYVNYETKVCIICPEHGEFWQTPHAHLNGQRCPICYGSIKLDTESFIERAKCLHGNKYDYSKVDYVNYETKVCIICPEHGEFWQTPHMHLDGDGCPLCGKRVYDQDSFIKYANQTHINKYDYSKVKYVNSEEKVCIICPEHGEFWQTPHNHISLKQGCPICCESKLERQIRILLEKEKINFEKEKTFEWLKNKGSLYLDFYLPDYNMAVECNGAQHFEPIKFFGGIETFLNRQKLDFLKYELCAEHNIKIIYFSNKKYNYFKKVITEENELIKAIHEQY